MRVDLDGEEAQDVFIDALLTFDFCNGRSRGSDVHEGVIGFAVLLDPVGQGAQAPAFNASDGAASGFDDSLELLDKGVDLLLGYVLAGHEHVFVQCHVVPFFLFVHDIQSQRLSL